MRLTKYEHACLVLEEQGKTLVIDPGDFTSGLEDIGSVVGLVITHQHPDHCDPKHIKAIVAAYPDVQIFAPADVLDKLPEGAHATAVTEGDHANVGPFTLRFFGTMHAEVHPMFTPLQNVGVLVNGMLYYPGDSFTLPGVAVNTLALPVSGPWLKTGEVIDFLDAVKPKQAIPTHDGLLSDKGLVLYEGWTATVCKQHGITWTALQPRDSIDI